MPRTKHHIKKKQKEPKLTREEMVYQAASDLAADIGMSYSEALGFFLGIENPYYGWEKELSEEEFQELINNHLDTNNEVNDDFDLF